ncbi:hypothetical protein [Nocardia inohanensis]|uniref:hypothetical protein n=1 Tax=Nocardia inohanensis TaxID=209246 RepID=UPI0008302C76|nr:hypothetical protein [Nocardia inohanensis]
MSIPVSDAEPIRRKAAALRGLAIALVVAGVPVGACLSFGGAVAFLYLWGMDDWEGQRSVGPWLAAGISMSGFVLALASAMLGVYIWLLAGGGPARRGRTDEP